MDIQCYRLTGWLAGRPSSGIDTPHVEPAMSRTQHRQHYRPRSVARVPRWIQRVWAWC